MAQEPEITSQNQWKGARFPYTLEGIAANAPKKSGIYAIGTKEEWVYIGEAGDIQDRLEQHCSGQSEESSCISPHDPDWFSYELPQVSFLRKHRERRLIEMYQPACNERFG